MDKDDGGGGKKPSHKQSEYLKLVHINKIIGIKSSPKHA